jgi:DHA1 family multidrug resistance protein-like MFS transporter
MRAFRTLHWTIFLISLPFGIIEFVLPIYGLDIGASAVEIGLFFTAFSLMLVILRPVVGAGLDRFGRRPFYIAGLIGYALTMLAFSLSTEVWAIVAARILQGTASAFLWLSAQTIIADSSRATERGRSFGSIVQYSSIGSIVGTFAGFGVLFPLGIDRGWLPLFVAYAITGLIAAIWAALRLPETHGEAARRTGTPIAWTRPWVLLLLVTFSTGAAWALISPILIIFLQQRLNIDVSTLAWAYLPAALIWAALPSRLGSLADRFGRKPLMVIALIAAAATSALIPRVSSLVALAGLWAFQALCYAAGDPAEQALVADLTGADQRGRAYGLYTMSAGLGFALGPLVGGWLYDTVSPATPFYANGALLAFNAAVLIAFLRVPPRTTEPPESTVNYLESEVNFGQNSD